MTRFTCKATFVIALVTLGQHGINSVKADLIFGTPIKMPGPINEAFWDISTSISADNLEVFFNSNRNGGWKLMTAQRDNVFEPFGTPEFVNTANHPSLSLDGLSLFFSDGGGRFGNHDLYEMKRLTTDDPWGPMINLGPNINTSAYERWPSISADGLSIYFNRDQDNFDSNLDIWPTEIWISQRPDLSSPFGLPSKIPSIINSGNANAASISNDGRTLFFSNSSAGRNGQSDILVSTRATTSDPWRAPVNLPSEINGPYNEWQPEISPDGGMLYFSRSRTSDPWGDWDIWQVSVEDIHKPEIVNVVAPSGVADTEGNDWGNLPTSPLRVQQLYLSSFFDSITGEQAISSLAWRPDERIDAYTGSDTFTIRLSTTEVDDLSMVFSENTGKDETLVFDGPVTFSTTANSSPRGFDFLVEFTEPFIYDPGRGNLLVDITTTGFDTEGGALDSVDFPGDRRLLVQTWAGNDVTSDTADGAFDFLHVMQFAFNDLRTFSLNGGGDTYNQDFDEMETGRRLPSGWSGVTSDGIKNSAVGLGLTDGFLTLPGSVADGVLGILNLGGNSESFGPAPDGFIPTWTAELGGQNDRFGRDDVIADGASDRALGVSRENNDDAGELNLEIEIADGTLRAFVLDWDLEIWGGDPDADFRSPEGPGMKVDVMVGGNSYGTMTENLLPGTKFDSSEDESGSVHNATLIDGNVYSVRNISSGIKEVSDADGAVGNMVQINFNSNWNDAADDRSNGWFSAIDNVRLRALAPGDADANGTVDVDDLLTLLAGQKFNQGVDGVTWEQGDFNADDQFNTGDLLAMLAFLSGQFPSDPYASEAGGAADSVADVIVNSQTGEITIDLAGHTASAIIIESAAEIFNGTQPDWDTTSQFLSTLPGELGNVLFTSTASGVDELGVVISAEFLGRDKEFYLQDLDLNISIASEGGALTKGNVIVVPEPSTWLLLLSGVLLVGWRQAKRSPGRQ